MIGQEGILEQLDIEYGIKELPRFIILTGPKGQGKKTLAFEIAKRYKYPYTVVGGGIEDIRFMIKTAYEQTEPIIYMILDADNLSLGAKNSLLKVVEEPPQNAFFIMTLEQIENTLATIKSRSQTFKLEDYNYNDKLQMIKEITSEPVYDHEKEILTKLDNYWQIKKVVDYGVIEFYSYVRMVYENIYKVQSANSFKLAERLDLKEDGNGYDLGIFFLMYQGCCVEDILQSNTEMTSILDNCIMITNRFKQMLAVKSANRQMLLDMWILAIRQEWLK